MGARGLPGWTDVSRGNRALFHVYQSLIDAPLIDVDGLVSQGLIVGPSMTPSLYDYGPMVYVLGLIVSTCPSAINRLACTPSRGQVDSLVYLSDSTTSVRGIRFASSSYSFPSLCWSCITGIPILYRPANDESPYSPLYRSHKARTV